MFEDEDLFGDEISVQNVKGKIERNWNGLENGNTNQEGNGWSEGWISLRGSPPSAPKQY